MPEDRGEETLLLEQIHQMSKDILEDLMQVDNRLAKLQDDIKQHDQIDKQTVLNELSELRTIVGNIEKEDIEEIKDEEICESMNKKLNDLIKMAIG